MTRTTTWNMQRKLQKAHEIIAEVRGAINSSDKRRHDVFWAVTRNALADASLCVDEAIRGIERIRKHNKEMKETLK